MGFGGCVYRYIMEGSEGGGVAELLDRLCSRSEKKDESLVTLDKRCQSCDVEARLVVEGDVLWDLRDYYLTQYRKRLFKMSWE